MKPSTRFNVMEANNMVAHTTAAFRFDVVDLHYVFQGLIHLRRDDIHWTTKAIRLMVNMILQHFVERFPSQEQEEQIEIIQPKVSKI